jgi:hypothetical protein
MQQTVIPYGDAGTMTVLANMRSLARAGSLDPLVRATAAHLVMGTGKDGSLHARLIRDFLAGYTLFLRDPTHAEALHAPRLMLDTIKARGIFQGDCDDIAILGAALGLAIGLRARYVAVGFKSPNAPFRHVWAELSDPRAPSWIELDTTRPNQPFAMSAISRRLDLEV